MNRLWRSVVGLIALVVVLVISTVSPSASSLAAPAKNQDPIGDLASCVRSTGVLEALFLFDTSGSLVDTDPKNRRIVAANAALTALADLAGSGKSSPISVDVRLAQFSVDYVPAAEWQSLNENSLASVRESVANVAARNDGIDTDFTNALSGARNDLAERSSRVRGNDGEPPCQALFLFTDGKFDVEARVGRLANAPGTPKAYAPDIPANSRENALQIIDAGKDALCRVGGIADAARIDDVTVIAIALSGKISDEDQQFLASVATGTSGATSCGDPAKARGAYFAAGDLGALISAFNNAASSIAGGTLVPGSETVTVCGGQSCPEGGRTFTVSAAMSRVTALVDIGRAEGSVFLRAPDGTTASLTSERADARLTGAVITSRWFDSAVSSVNIQFTDHESSLGEWTVTLVAPVGGATGRIQLFAYTDLSAQLASDPDLRSGQQSAFTVRIIGDGSDAVRRLAGSKSVVSISASDPSTKQPITIPLTANAGTWSGTWLVPKDWTASETVLSTRLEIVTSAGLAFEPVITRTPVKVQKPASYPQVSPSSLRLGTVDGKGQAKGSITVTGGTQPGCIAFGDVTYSAVPSSSQPLTFESPLKPGDCLAIAPRSTQEIPVSFKLSKSMNGPVRATLPVIVSSDADA
ncbi:MAG: VWA domain-containing protein, partial [Actinomycetes bacterium]